MIDALRFVAGHRFVRTTALCLIAYGIAVSSTIPYQSLYAVKELGMGNGAFSAFMSAVSVVSVIAAVGLGAVSDTLRDRRPLVLVLALAGALGYGAIWLGQSVAAYVIAMLTLIPLSRAITSLLFSGLRRELPGLDAGQMLSVNSLLRTFLAGAWVVTPAFAAWFVSGSQSLAAVFLIGAVASLSVFLLYLTLPAPKGNAEKAPRLPFGDLLRLIASRPVLLRVLAISLGSGAHALHGLLHPLFMTGPAHGTLRDVGLFAGMLAGLEIPFMLVWAQVARKKSVSFALSASLAIYCVYAVLLAFATAPWHLFALGILNSCGAAAVLSLPMSYFQDLLADRPGLGSSLVPVVTFFGGLVSAAGFAIGAALGGYSQGAFIVAALCAASAFLIQRADRLGRPG